MDTRSSALALLAIASCLSPLPTAAQDSGWTEDERHALTRGELVRRDLRQRGARRAFGGVSFLWIEAPVETVWAKASDASVLTALIPTLASARVVEERAGERVIRMHHSYGVGETNYYLHMTLDEARHELHFEVDASRPRDVTSGNGFLRLTAHRGGTLVTWGMRMDPGVGVLGELFGSMLDAWLLKPPLCLRDEVDPGDEPAC